MPNEHPHAPQSAWAPIALRVDIVRQIELPEAAYWLVAECERVESGVVASFRGRDLYAWPGQVVDNVILTHLRLGDVAEAVSRAGRWGAARKLALLDMLAQGAVDRDTAMAEFGISETELAEWQGSIEDLKRKSRLAGAAAPKVAA